MKNLTCSELLKKHINYYHNVFLMSTEEDAVEQNHLKALNNKNELKMWLNNNSQLDIRILNMNELNMVIW